MTIEAVSLWSLGALFGLRHALEPDHLVAVSTLVTHRPGARTALGIGIAWGAGHTLALLGVASVLAVARGRLSPAVVAAFELGVGLMLVLLGVQSVRRTFTRAPVPELAPTHATARRSILIGIAHGLAGSGAVTALIASQFPSVAGRIGYVAVFGIGSMIGMAGMSGLAGASLARASRRPGLAKGLAAAGGVLAIALGIIWVTRELRALLA